MRLQVGWPDNPGNPGEIADTGFEHNAVQPWLAAALWSLLTPQSGNGPWRYVDGTNVYPSLAELWDNYQNSASVFPMGVASVGTNRASGAIPLLGTAQILALALSTTMGAMVIGNYTGVVPSGSLSLFTASNWTTYSLIRRYANNMASVIFENDSNFFGPAVTSESLTSGGYPNPSVSLSRTFAATAGTVNAIAFVPLSLAGQTVTTTVALNTANVLYPNYVKAIAGNAGTSTIFASSFTRALAGAGEPFTAGDLVVASTFYQASSPLAIPAGANLTVTYTFTATL